MSDDIIKRLREAIAALDSSTAYVMARSDYDLAASPDNIAALIDRLDDAIEAARTWENEAERRSRRYEECAVKLDVAERENKRLREWEVCAREWLDKTEWVQKEVQPKRLGWHRADIMRDEIERLRAENDALRESIGMAYGYLWCVNNEPGTPFRYPPEKAAYEARAVLRDTMTSEQRGTFINRVVTMVRGKE